MVCDKKEHPHYLTLTCSDNSIEQVCMIGVRDVNIHESDSDNTLTVTVLYFDHVKRMIFHVINYTKEELSQVVAEKLEPASMAMMSWMKSWSQQVTSE